MEIAGKYLGVTVRYEEMVAILGWDPPRMERDFQKCSTRRRTWSRWSGSTARRRGPWPRRRR
jgi:hypothetical protein